MTACIEPVTLHRTTTTNIINFNFNFKLHLDLDLKPLVVIIFNWTFHCYQLSFPAAIRIFRNSVKSYTTLSISMFPNWVSVFRFVLKGPLYNPCDVMNCLIQRRGYMMQVNYTSQWKINHLNPFVVRALLTKSHDIIWYRYLTEKHLFWFFTLRFCHRSKAKICRHNWNIFNN